MDHEEEPFVKGGRGSLVRRKFVCFPFFVPDASIFQRLAAPLGPWPAINLSHRCPVDAPVPRDAEGRGRTCQRTVTGRRPSEQSSSKGKKGSLAGQFAAI